MRRALTLALSIGMILAMTSPAHALDVLTKVRIAGVQVFDDGRARVAFEYICPGGYDYHALITDARVSQPGGAGASTSFNDEVVCDGTTHRLVKTLRSTTGEPFVSSHLTRIFFDLVLMADSAPWPGALSARENVSFAPGGARLAFDVNFRRVWVSDLGKVKTRFTYKCPTGVVYDEGDVDTVEIKWFQTQPGAGDIGNQEDLVSDLVCDDTLHTVVKSESNQPSYSPAFPIRVQIDFGITQGLTVLPE